MQRNRTSLLAPFFSSMAILSFKKKGKEDEGLGMPSSSSPTSEMSLGGGDISLSGLGGGIGSLSSINLDDDSSDDLGGSLLSMSGAMQDDRKLQELEAGVNDIKKQTESAELASRTMRGDIESIKEEVSHMNESIKSLLNVYEAVSRQYNPFVEDESTKREAPSIDETSGSKDGTTLLSDDVCAMIKELYNNGPVDEEGPLDRIVRPDDDLMDNHPLTLGAQGEMTMERKHDNIVGPIVQSEELRISEGSPMKVIGYENAYALEQTRRMLECLMTKICRECYFGREIDAADRRAFELWMDEFRRLGGL